MEKKKSGCLKIGLIVCGVLLLMSIIGALIGGGDSTDSKSTDDNNAAATAADVADKEENDSIVKEKLRLVDAELSKMKPLFDIKYDEFEKTTWIHHKNEPKYVNAKGFYTYIGLKEDNVWQRLVIRYHGDSWLFLQKITVKADDATFELAANDVERDNDRNVWEWVNISPGKTEIAMIASIVAAQKTQVRFTGKQYAKDWTLTQKEVKGLKETQTYYNLLREKMKLEKEQ